MARSYFEVPFNDTLSVCGCCAMDETLMGRFAPIRLKSDHKFKLYINWFYENVAAIYPDFNIEFLLDERPESAQSSHRPDTAFIISDRDDTRCVVLHLECDGTLKKFQNSITRDNGLYDSSAREHNSKLKSFISVHIYNMTVVAANGISELYSDFTNILLYLLKVQTSLLSEHTQNLYEVPDRAKIFYNYTVGAYDLCGFNITTDDDKMVDLLRPWVQDPLDSVLKFKDEWLDSNFNFSRKIKGKDFNIYNTFFPVVKYLVQNMNEYSRMFIYFHKGHGYIGRLRRGYTANVPSNAEKVACVGFPKKDGNWRDTFPIQVPNYVVRMGARLFKIFIRTALQRIDLYTLIVDKRGAGSENNDKSITVLQFNNTPNSKNEIANIPENL